MDDYPTQLNRQLGATEGPLSQERASEFNDVAETLKERLQEARNCAEEDHTVKRLDSQLNHVLFGAVTIAFINKFATTQPNFRLYPFQTTLVAGLYEVFHAVDNGTFTSSTFLSVFAAPSFTLWALQGIIDACLFVSPLVVVAAIFGKWFLGHFSASRGEDRHEQTRKQLPLHAWPKDSRARVLSWLEALHTILAVSEALYCTCWMTGKNPLTGISILVGVAAICSPALFMLYRMKNADL